MSERAESLVDLAVEALLTRDMGKAEAVLTGDREVDKLEVEVEAMAVELLALQQPMAKDLRFIIAAIKASADLERVGDHAVNIAQSAQRIIATNWVRWALSHGAVTPASGAPRRSSAPSPGNPASAPVGDANCSDFSSHAAAQQWFEQHGGSPSNDVAGLDRDHDGLACESLP